MNFDPAQFHPCFLSSRMNRALHNSRVRAFSQPHSLVEFHKPIKDVHPQLLSFDILAKVCPHNSFLLIFIQNARGCGYAPRSLPSTLSLFCTRAKFIFPISNALRTLCLHTRGTPPIVSALAPITALYPKRISPRARITGHESRVAGHRFTPSVLCEGPRATVDFTHQRSL